MRNYDRIAKLYDKHYTDPISLAENNELAEMLKQIINDKSKVLDIGCGTGLALDLINVRPENYLGIDPSQEMLNILVKKHPNYITILGKYEDMAPRKADVALALFSGHYIADAYKYKLVQQAPHYLYMFAKPDYAPDWYYTPEEQNASKHLTDYDMLYKMFDLTEWHNYLIAYK